MNMVSVAVIDDGIKEGIFQPCKLTESVLITKNLKAIQCKNSNNDFMSHGTICGGILYQACPNIELHSVKIKDANRNGDMSRLLRAIEYCVEKKIKIISLSVGSTSQSDEEPLKKCICDAINNNTIVVAAYSNQMVKTYPACMDGVIGVCHSVKAMAGLYKKKIDGNVVFCEYGVADLTQTNGCIYRTDIANSFAVPRVTARIAGYCNDNMAVSASEVYQYLLKQCIN